MSQRINTYGTSSREHKLTRLCHCVVCERPAKGQTSIHHTQLRIRWSTHSTAVTTDHYWSHWPLKSNLSSRRAHSVTKSRLHWWISQRLHGADNRRTNCWCCANMSPIQNTLSSSACRHYTGWSKKTVPQFYFCDNFRKCTPIFTIFSPLEPDIYDA